jgi:hypothetical protein
MRKRLLVRAFWRYDDCMQNDTLEAYISGERARGVSDAALRDELLAKGWEVALVNAALPSVPMETKRESPLLLGFRRDDLMLRTLLVGFLSFLVSSVYLLLATFMGERNSLTDHSLLYLMLSLTHVVNFVAFGLLFWSVWELSRALSYRIWIGFLLLLALPFGLTSLPDFVSIAIDYNLYTGELNYAALVIYLFFLPLDGVVYLLLLITEWVILVKRRRKGGVIPSRTLLWTTGLFLFVALLAFGDVMMILGMR